MAEELKNVIIIGAGGNLGPFILQAFDNDPRFSVSVLSRKSSKLTFESHIKTHSVNDDYPEEELLATFKGQDVVVCLIKSHLISENKRIIDAAIKAGVKKFIPSEFSSNATQSDNMVATPVGSGKIEIVKYLQSKEGSGMTWSALVTGAFFDWGMQKSFLGFHIPSRQATIFDEGNAKFNGTNMSTIGAAVVAIVTHPDLTANKYVSVNSFLVGQNQILAALEKATGEKWTTTYVSTEETKKIGLEKLAKEDPSAGLDLIRAALFGGDEGMDYSRKGLFNEQLGLPKEESLEEVIKNIVEGDANLPRYSNS